jgi:hypothetical protein
MSQSNFANLVIIPQNEIAVETMTTYTAEVVGSSEITENAVTLFAENKANPNEVVFDSVNLIPVELYDFLAASDPMELDSIPLPVAQDMFEPARRVHDFAPPRRYYRRFWRSAARRIYQKEYNPETSF